ncbi:hypothetical protein F5Y16DRAFT_400640 [Xylariaceae sp. FL0255]|nr:hypothetical protein F5Y16DRAFT_400640 [Xylariaceae sp. FL0255]
MLAGSDDDGSFDGEPAFRLVDNTWKCRFYYLLAVSISLMLPLTGTLLYTLQRPQCTLRLPPGVKQPYTPVKLNYVNRVLHEDPDTPKFIGKPRPELDEAWHQLLDTTLIRFSAEELDLANGTSIAHKDGGYVGGLGISHTLHCLDWAGLEWHVDHCLESIRKEALCKADADIYTLEWLPQSNQKPSVTVPQAHMCVDWESLHGWMKQRSARYDEMVKPPAEFFRLSEKSARDD